LGTGHKRRSPSSDLVPLLTEASSRNMLANFTELVP
jgi:hypothetical protein